VLLNTNIWKSGTIILLLSLIFSFLRRKKVPWIETSIMCNVHSSANVDWAEEESFFFIFIKYSLLAFLLVWPRFPKYNCGQTKLYIEREKASCMAAVVVRFACTYTVFCRRLVLKIKMCFMGIFRAKQDVNVTNRVSVCTSFMRIFVRVYIIISPLFLLLESILLCAFIFLTKFFSAVKISFNI